MKFYTAAAVLLVSIFATSMALPARMTYYQQPSFFYQAQTSPERVMYLQYVQQPSTNSRLTNAAAAFVSGNTVATGTYLKDDVSEIAEESILDNTQVELEDTDTDVVDTDDADVSETSELPEDSQVLGDEDSPVARELPEAPVEDEPELVADESAEPEVAEDDENAENDDDDDDDEYLDDGTSNSPKASSGVSGGFFPIDFGSTNGGSIAVANSYSTGSNGLAKSQAIAYGKSESTKYKARRH